MKEKNKEHNSNTKETKQQSVEVPIQVYFFVNITVFSIGGLPSTLIVFFYLHFCLGLPSTTFLGIEDFWTWFFFPLIIIFATAVCIYMMGWLSALFDKKWNKKSPPVEGLFQRVFGEKDVVDMRIKYYHYRGFVIKWPLWVAAKSPFPWLQNWVLRYVGHNKIDKTATYVDAFPSLEFSELGKNVVFLPGAMASSHVVDSLFGNLTIEKLRVGENSTLHSNSILAPGSKIHEQNSLMPFTFAIKRWESISNVKYYNLSPAKSFEDKYAGVFSVLPKKMQEIFQNKGYVLGTEIDGSRS